MATHWTASVGQGHQRAQELYGHQYHTIRYEDLLQDPTAQMKRAFDFLQLEFEADLQASILEAMNHNPAATWHQQAAPELASHLRRGESGSWADWFTERDHQRFLEVATDQLIAWDYPLNR